MCSEVLPAGVGVDELLAHRHTYLTTGVVPAATRPVVADSWHRSRAFGVAPGRMLRQPCDRQRLLAASVRSARLMDAAVALLGELHASLSEQPHLLALADPDGLILWLRADDSCKALALDESNLFEGASWHERDIGANGIGTSLATGAPVALVGPEHFADAYMDWTCVGVPLRDPQGTIIGSLDLSVPNEHVQLPTWGLMLTMARAIERQLAGAAPEHWPDEHPNQPLSALRGILEFLLRDEAFGERKALLDRARTALDSAEHVLRNAMEETSRRRTEIEARQQFNEYSLNEFVHEMRNALTAVNTTIGAMAVRPGDSALFERAHEMIEQHARQLNRLLDDLLDVQLIERGKLRLEPETVNLNEVVEQAADAVRDSAQRRRHQLQLRVPQDLELVGDRVRLVQIMTNLLTNAVRYTPDGGSIAVEACSLGSIVELRVRDSGVGIDPDLVSRLFDPFVQGPGGHRAGLGVGLNLVQRLVVAHGGSIRVCSEGPGCGSEFRVQLPAAGAAWEEPRPPVTAVS